MGISIDKKYIYRLTTQEPKVQFTIGILHAAGQWPYISDHGESKMIV